MPMKVAVIPARGGSKRIPKKNIKTFYGKPMIAWSIEAAVNSGIFDKVIVSTDNEEISNISLEYGAEVPFIRPDEISDDYAVTTEVIAHSANWFKKEGLEVESITCIYATAPFLDVEDLIEGINIFESESWEYVFTVTDFAAPIFRAFRQTQSGGLEMYYPEFFETRSQDLPQALHDAGQFYIARPTTWVKNKRIFDKNSRPLIIPRYRVQDIDTEEDWERAEMMAPSLLNK
jgi:pseudaminic acid cytidylyltransferase